MAGGALIRGERDFRRLWAGDAVSQLGTQVSVLAIPLLAADTLHATAWDMALLTAAPGAAFLVVGLPAGVWCDRMRRRPVLIAADLGRAVVLASIPAASILGALSMAQVLAVCAVAGVLGVFFDVSYQSYLPALVGRERIIEGNGALEANRTLALTAGPAMAGYLFQWLGGPLALLADAASFAWSGAWIASIRARESTPPLSERRHLMREIGEGLRFVLGHPVLRAIALYGSTMMLFGSAQRVVLILFLVRAVHLSPGTIGVLFTCGSAGALLGALSAARIARRAGAARGILLATLLDCGAGLLLPLAARGPALGLYLAGATGGAFGVSVFNVIQVSFRQALCPDRLLGRMNATMRFVLWGSGPLGALLGGALGTGYGLRTTMWITAIGQVLPLLWIVTSPIARHRDLPTPTAPRQATYPGRDFAAHARTALQQIAATAGSGRDAGTASGIDHTDGHGAGSTTRPQAWRSLSHGATTLPPMAQPAVDNTSGISEIDGERVAWVTGASRGLGRGIALALGRAGWTVYVTARSSATGRTGHLPGTIEDCAHAVTAAGGRGIAAICDHRDDDAVTAAAERIAAGHQRLDLLVNNVWGGYERLNAGAWEEWNAPMWRQPMELFDAMFGGGVRAHYVALARCAPLLIATPASAVVTVSFTVTDTPDQTFGAAYAAAKCADDRLAVAAAAQLRPHGVASLALHPALVRTEGVMQFAEHLDLEGSQSPEGVGRAIVALTRDPNLMDLSGRVLSVTELADRYAVDVVT